MLHFRNAYEHGRSHVNAKELENTVLEDLTESTCNFIIVSVDVCVVCVCVCVCDISRRAFVARVTLPPFLVGLTLLTLVLVRFLIPPEAHFY